MWTRVGLVVALVACGPKKPAENPKLKALEAELAEARDALAKERAAAEALRQSTSELEAKANEAKALQDKLAEVVGKYGEVTTADGAVRLELVDQILFPTGEADLTDNGKAVLAKVGAALADVDKQVWVQGHTDDQPIVVRKPKPAPAAVPAKAVKGKKGVKPPEPKQAEKPDGPDAIIPFTTNWELAAARALTVVHYLQDEAKLDPRRLAAVAFGQYRPISKKKAKNRRIEIVLYPPAKISPK